MSLPPDRAQDGDACQRVSAYVSRFLDEGPVGGGDMGDIGDHAARCPSCYARLSAFFKTVELPESRFLEESIDELAFSLYNLARALIRERKHDGEEDEQAVIQVTEEGGGTAAENLEVGTEMLDEVEDFSGSTFVHGMNLGELRGLLQDAETAEQMREDLALQVFHRITEMRCRYVARAWNWIGALNYQRQRFDDAESALRRMLQIEEDNRDARAYAHCTLSYIHKHRGELDEAIRSARRSSVLAQEDDRDPYFGRFAEFYFLLLRGKEGDTGKADRLLSELTATEDGRSRLKGDLLAGPNKPVLDAFQASDLADRLPVDPSADGPAGGARPPL